MQRLETKLIGKETVVKDLELRQCVKWTFKKGRYTCREIKEKLQLIYDQHGVNKRAKSTQIKEFCEVKPIVMRDKSGMSAKGFEIM